MKWNTFFFHDGCKQGSLNITTIQILTYKLSPTQSTTLNHPEKWQRGAIYVLKWDTQIYEETNKDSSIFHSVRKTERVCVVEVTTHIMKQLERCDWKIMRNTVHSHQTIEVPFSKAVNSEVYSYSLKLPQWMLKFLLLFDFNVLVITAEKRCKRLLE